MSIQSSFFISIMSCMALYSNSQVDLINSDFESGIPINYTILDNDGLTPDVSVSEYTDAWISVEDPSNNINHVAGSTSFFSPTGKANRWLITPPLTLGSYGNFASWYAKSHDASFPDDYLVLVSTTDNLLESFVDTIGYVIEEYAEWTSRTVDLGLEGYNDQTIYIAFINITNNGFKLYLDDIKVWKEDPVSVQSLDVYEPAVYPNPFNDMLHVKFDQIPDEITVYSVSGQRVKSVNNSSTIETEGLSSGVYILNILVNGKIFTKKLLHQ